MTTSDVADPAWKAPPHPLVYEINTWPWLDALSGEADMEVTLGDVPSHEWDAIAAAGFDAVWLMGVWERSPAGVAVALANPELARSFGEALPDLTPQDVVGSPYCVRAYTVADHLGGPEGLRAARDALARRGLGLILDFVPNHVAPDHPWVLDHPERFVLGTAEDLVEHPSTFVELGGAVIAHGRDPYFPAWPDVVQLDAFEPGLRAAAVDTLRSIADQCDGVRCDMAMLMMNDIFEQTWGRWLDGRPDDDYWPTVIGAVHQTHPGFLFIAEAYWDLEWELQEQGFDHCYDKRLYDRLLASSVDEVRAHLTAGDDHQRRLLRFVENHDEPRLASLVDPARQKAMTVAALTQCGARLVHDGQMEGRKVHLPVFLGRFPAEPTDDDLVDFHRSLLGALADPTFHHGRWELGHCSDWDGGPHRRLLACSWSGDTRWLVVVNLGDSTAAGEVRAPWPDLRGHTCLLSDPTSGAAFEREGDTLCDGLYVELAPWSWHLLRVETA